MSALIIAEAGVNHNGDRDTALALVDAAAAAGVDAVKFQTFRTESLVTSSAPKAAYQKIATGSSESQFDMLKRLEMSADLHRELMERCTRHGLKFLSTPFDQASLHFLVHELDLDTLKISSGEITNGPFLLDVAKHGRKIILSTGMSTLKEVEEALGVIAFGFANEDHAPSREAFHSALASRAGQKALDANVSLLHCTTEYPAPFSDVNLKAIDTLRETFGLTTGLSDHTPGITAAIAAVSRGATIIEKHFTLDRSLPGPDHAASLEPDELKALAAEIRVVEMALGDGIKAPSPSEMGNRKIARKSLVASRSIKAGEVLIDDNISAKRLGAGVSPMYYWDVLGTKAKRDYLADEAIDL